MGTLNKGRYTPNKAIKSSVPRKEQCEQLEKRARILEDLMKTERRTEVRKKYQQEHSRIIRELDFMKQNWPKTKSGTM